MDNSAEGFRYHCEDQGYRNNRCAGYALAAVLSDIEEKERSGLKTYEALLQRQQSLPLNSACGRFLNDPNNIFDGTRMILPADIVLYCLSLNLNAKIICSDKRETIFGTEVFEEDCSLVKGYVYDLCSDEGFEKGGAVYRYLLALTRFKHWVALKSTPSGYYLFDPAPPEFGGGTFGPAAFSKLLPLEKTGTSPVKYFYELLIGINEHII